MNNKIVSVIIKMFMRLYREKKKREKIAKVAEEGKISVVMTFITVKDNNMNT